MPVFNVAGSLNRKTGGTGSYNFLVDQLDIKQSQLESDGNLSPGDYDLLYEMAQKIYSHSSLTEDQRSNVNVKMARYKKDKSVSGLNDSGDIPRINREVQDDESKLSMRFSNDPEKFLMGKVAVYDAKIEQLSQSIDSKEAAGDDASNYYNELNNTLIEYNDSLQALDDVKNSKANPGAEPTSNFAAYVTTNSQGEIVDMKISRVGSQTGYNETNGLYSGLPVYGKLNRKDQSGNKIFQLGNQTFSASDVTLPGPDGTMKASVLISSDKQKTAKGGFSVAESGYTVVDPTTVRPQGSVRTGGWIEGEKGFLYQRKEDGTYSKYVNYDKERLGIDDTQIIRVPRSFEQGIIGSVSETKDFNAEPMLPMGGDPAMNMNTSTTTPAVSGGLSMDQKVAAANETLRQAGPGPMSSYGNSSPRTPAPTERSPQGASAIAGEQNQQSKGFFSRLFGF